MVPAKQRLDGELLQCVVLMKNAVRGYQLQVTMMEVVLIAEWPRRDRGASVLMSAGRVLPRPWRGTGGVWRSGQLDFGHWSSLLDHHQLDLDLIHRSLHQPRSAAVQKRTLESFRTSRSPICLTFSLADGQWTLHCMRFGKLLLAVHSSPPLAKAVSSSSHSSCCSWELSSQPSLR